MRGGWNEKVRDARTWVGRLALLMVGVLSAPALAEEGMWTFDQIPTKEIEARLGVSLSLEWLNHARLSALSGPDGCSSSFVSATGLVLTNHHCVRTCLQAISRRGTSNLERGFLADNRYGEVACRGVQLDQLVEIRDVTREIRPDSADESAVDKRRGRVLRRCPKSPLERCRLVALHGGEAFHLYRYRRFTDVRLVFAPEVAVADFGGEPYNFTFPRFAFDAALLRVYESGRPVDSSGNFLRWSDTGPVDGEPAFVVGKPISSNRNRTMAQLHFERDVKLTRDLLTGVALKAHLEAFAHRGAEQRKVAEAALLSVTNTLKYYKHTHRSLSDPALLREKAAREAELRSKVSQDADLGRTLGDAWSKIEDALRRHQTIYDRLQLLEGNLAYTGAVHSSLFGVALDVVRRAQEGRPSARDLSDIAASTRASGGAIPDEFEIAKLAFLLTRMAEELDPNDPVVRRVFRHHTPEGLAELMVTHTRLRDGKFRKALVEGGAAAVAASTDPMVVFMRDIAAPARELRRQHEREIEPVIASNQQLIDKALFRLGEPGSYPQATDTLRLSYGKVAGLRQDGVEIAPLTTIGGAFERSTGLAPLSLPRAWLDAKSELRLDVPLNFISTNDAASGNSGSPVLNAKGELIGLVFDCNVPSVCGSWGFDTAIHRVVSVHAAGILEILSKVYKAESIVDELRPPRSGVEPESGTGK